MSKKNFKQTRYSRFVPLPSIGSEGMKKIRNAKATVVGCGGLGSVSASQLAALGIGHLRIIDNDIIELSNLQRQLLYREKDIGKPKAVIAKKFLEELNPEVTIEAIQEEITEDNVNIASDSVDFIVDAVDKFTPRFLLNKSALEQNIPFIFGAVSGLSGNTMTIKRGSVCLECLFNQVDDEKLPTSAETGIHPSIIQIIGSIQIAEASRIMLHEEPLLLNKLLFCDLGSMQFDTLQVKQKEECICKTFSE
ncbi:MAG: HesA/MoeB/ThiF family protein [Candidatus Heimdallarchaeota archaeon]